MAAKPALIQIANLVKSFSNGEKRNEVIRGLSLEIPAGSFQAIVGPSGSGKTTLLGLIGGLDRADSGRLIVDGEDIQRFSMHELLRYRRNKVGFIFQSYNLLATLTALENVELGMQFFSDLPRREKRRRAEHYLRAVGLGDQLRRFPAQLSGGEQQRVAVARALAREPQLVLADEPTGNLDQATGEKVGQLLKTLQQDQGTTCLVVTHNLEFAAMADEIIHLRDGQVQSEPTQGGSHVMADRHP